MTARRLFDNNLISGCFGVTNSAAKINEFNRLE